MRRDARKKGFRGWLQRRAVAARSFLSQDVWSKELGALPTLRALFYKSARIVYLTGRGFDQDRCLMRAAALTFITGLSIVPLLAFAFAVAKGLGAYDTLLGDVINPFLDRVLGGGAEGTEAGIEVRAALDEVLGVVQKTNVGSLGAFGLIILVYTIVKLLGSIEQALNEIWGVHKPRTLVRKVADYLSIVVIVPILLTTSAAVTAAIHSERVTELLSTELGLGAVAALYARFSSLVAVWVGFTFVYLFMPNTRVRVTSALLGGLAGGLLWQLAQVLHVKFQVGVANYNAIYSTFAALPIFMFWLYLSWVTVLLGAEVACAHQSEPTFRQAARAKAHDLPVLQVLALRALTRVGVSFLQGERPSRLPDLADALSVPERSLDEAFAKLRDAGIVVLAEDQADFESSVLPARDLDHITIQEVLDALTGRAAPLRVPAQSELDREVDRVLELFLEEREAVAHNLTLRRLAMRVIESGSEELGEGEARAAIEGAS